MTGETLLGTPKSLHTPVQGFAILKNEECGHGPRGCPSLYCSTPKSAVLQPALHIKWILFIMMLSILLFVVILLIMSTMYF